MRKESECSITKTVVSVNFLVLIVFTVYVQAVSIFCGQCHIVNDYEMLTI